MYDGGNTLILSSARAENIPARRTPKCASRITIPARRRKTGMDTRRDNNHNFAVQIVPARPIVHLDARWLCARYQRVVSSE
jgi:hypothetical protein